MTNWALWGTIVNTAAVLIGALLGLAIKAMARRAAKGVHADVTVDEARPSRMAELPFAVQKALGLCAALIGILGAVKIQSVLIMILSMVLGTVVGQLLDLDGLLNRFGRFVERSMKGRGANVAEGFVCATLLFCVGAMTVTGAIESGMLRQHSTYYAKSMLDLVSSVIFASTLGVGVLFSAVAVFGIQGVLTLVAMLAAGALSPLVIGEMIAVGSLLVIAIGTNLLGMTKLKVMNMLPAMFLPIGLCPLFDLIPML